MHEAANTSPVPVQKKQLKVALANKLQAGAKPKVPKGKAKAQAQAQAKAKAKAKATGSKGSKSSSFGQPAVSLTGEEVSWQQRLQLRPEGCSKCRRAVGCTLACWRGRKV